MKIELHTLKDHLKRAHNQFSAFRQVQLEAKNNPDPVTIHIDWSQNAKLRQAREEKVRIAMNIKLVFMQFIHGSMTRSGHMSH